MATSNGDEKKMPLPRVHCFICTQCSYDTGHGPADPEMAKNFRGALKKICKNRFPRGHVRINQTSCLGFCEQGISSVIYPQRIVKTDLRPGSESQFADFIAQVLSSLD